MDYINFCDQLNNDLAQHNMISMPVKCSIEYWGRSRSVIGEGDRVILIKPDTTLLVHSVEGFKPINWMSSPADTIAEPLDNMFRLHSQRTRTPYEEMKITVKKIYDYSVYCGLRDGKKLELTHTEKDMQDYLAARPHLIHKDFRLKATEYRTPLGFLDLYGKLGDRYCVVELKADKAGLPASLQIKRYTDWLGGHVKDEVESYLIAPSITDNAKKLLEKNRIKFKRFDIKKIKRRPLSRNTLSKWIDDGSEKPL